MLPVWPDPGRLQDGLGIIATSKPKSMAIQPGTRIGAYEILSPLGAGGMGEVYAARDTRLHRQVAIKFLSSEVSSDPQHRERFEREARAVAALNHPNIVTLYSVEEVDGQLFLAMELVNGRTLQEVIPAGGLSIKVLLRTATSITEAVAAAHQQGITHRDLKPANVMITADGVVKVLDFGLAKVHAPDHADLSTRADLTEQYQVIGTVSHMSPEQAEGKPVDSRSDIFSLGVMLHEMATGQRPFRGDSSASIISAILRDDPQLVSEIQARTSKRSRQDCQALSCEGSVSALPIGAGSTSRSAGIDAGGEFPWQIRTTQSAAVSTTRRHSVDRAGHRDCSWCCVGPSRRRRSCVCCIRGRTNFATDE